MEAKLLNYFIKGNKNCKENYLFSIGFVNNDLQF